jgi:hypothetical protein
MTTVTLQHCPAREFPRPTQGWARGDRFDHVLFIERQDYIDRRLAVIRHVSRIERAAHLIEAEFALATSTATIYSACLGHQYGVKQSAQFYRGEKKVLEFPLCHFVKA